MKASAQNKRVISPKPGKLVEVDGRILGVNLVGGMVEVGGKVMEVDEVEDDFAFCGGGPELLWITEKMQSWFEVKVRALLRPEDGDDKHAIILGRHVRWTAGGIEYEADPKHRKLIMEHFGFDEESSGLIFNEEKDWMKEEE